MLKRLLAPFSAVVIALTVFAFAGAAMAQSVRLRLSVGANEHETDGMSVGLRAMRDYVAARSNGEIEIQIFWNTLGGSLQVTEMVKNGTLDMALTDDSVLGSFHAPMNALQIPYLFSSSPVAWAFSQTDIVRAMIDEMRLATGIRTLAFSENGFRNLTNNVRPLRTPDDMSGLRMRTMQSQVYVEFMRSMGATATPIAWPELVPALRTGVVDGQENAATTIIAGRLYEVQRYLSLNGHIYGFHLIIVNDEVFNGLSTDHQMILREGAMLHAQIANALKARAEVDAVDELRALGMTIHVTTPAERQQFRAASQPAVIEFLSTQVGADVVNRVLEAARQAEAQVYGY